MALETYRAYLAERQTRIKSEFHKVKASVLEDYEALSKRKDFLESAIPEDFSSWLVAKKRVHPKIAYVLANFFVLDEEARFSAISKLRGKGDIAAALTSVVRLCHEMLNINAILLVLDEIELLWRGWASSKRQNFAVWLRGIHETGGGHVRLIMIHVPDILSKEEIESKYRHIVDVMPFGYRTVLSVNALDATGTKELISVYLEPARRAGTKGFIEPFDDLVLEEINIRHRGIAREILYKSYELVEYAADSKLKRLDLAALSSIS